MATITAKTSTYTWQGLDRQGRQAQGEVQSISQTMAKAQLPKQGIVAKNIKKKASLFSAPGNQSSQQT